MPFPLHVINPRVLTQVTTPRRVSLVRFVRAIGGVAGAIADETAPEVEDRGLAIPGTIQGPRLTLTAPATGQVGIVQRIRVMRDRLEPTAQLFPKLSSSSRIELIHPLAGSAINPNPVPGNNGVATFDGDHIFFRTKPGSADRVFPELRLHFGSVSGPVVGELQIDIYKPLSMPVRVHRVSIDGQRATFPDARVNDLIQDMANIYAQAGIRVTLQDIVDDPDHAFGNSPVPPPANLPPGVVFPAGVVLPAGTMLRQGDNFQMAILFNTNAHPQALNCYIIPHLWRPFNATPTLADALDQIIGVGFSRSSADNTPITQNTVPGAVVPPGLRHRVGFFMLDSLDRPTSAGLISHEAGHVIDLQHYDNRQQGSAAPLLDDYFICRNLMHPIAGFPVTAATLNGYGLSPGGGQNGGQCIGVRKQSTIFQGDQITVMRRAVSRRLFRP